MDETAEALEAPAESPVELAARIRAGEDREAEARLVSRYARGVRILLDRHTRSVAEAEDLFQETFALAVAKLRAGELRDPSKLAGFLASLARNLATEHYRKATRRRTDADDEAVQRAASAAPGQLGQLLRGEEALLVRRVLHDLSTDRDREILFRFYVAEEDKDAIAADHDLDSLQFNRVLHRARQRYKALYLERLAAVGHARARLVAPLLVCALLRGIVAAGASIRFLGSLKG